LEDNPNQQARLTMKNGAGVLKLVNGLDPRRIQSFALQSPVDRLLSVSTGRAERRARQVAIASDRIQIVRNGVERSRFERRINQPRLAAPPQRNSLNGT
jgi:hypothetical protein